MRLRPQADAEGHATRRRRRGKGAKLAPASTLLPAWRAVEGRIGRGIALLCLGARLFPHAVKAADGDAGKRTGKMIKAWSLPGGSVQPAGFGRAPADDLPCACPTFFGPPSGPRRLGLHGRVGPAPASAALAADGAGGLACVPLRRHPAKPAGCRNQRDFSPLFRPGSTAPKAPKGQVRPDHRFATPAGRLQEPAGTNGEGIFKPPCPQVSRQCATALGAPSMPSLMSLPAYSGPPWISAPGCHAGRPAPGKRSIGPPCMPRASLRNCWRRSCAWRCA